jgi:hypothetical protein
VSFEGFRLAGIHRIATEGSWTVVCSSETFTTDPLDAYILWHNGETTSRSDSLCLMKLREITALEK